MTRKLAIVGLLLVLVGTGAFVVLRRSRGTDPVAPRPPDASAVRAADASLSPPVPADGAAGERTATTVPAPEVAASPVVEAPTTPPAPAPDLEARDWIEIRVVDEQDLPVEDAEVRIFGLRPEGDTGSVYGVDGEEPVGRTDAQGRVRLSYRVWVTIDGRTLQIDLLVNHPDFVSFRDHSFAIGPGEHAVVLRKGAVVVVSGWVGTPDVVVADLKIRVDRESRLPRDAWKREPDGRLSTNRLAPGPHLLWLEHTSEQHGPCFSRIESFALAENEWKELHLELQRADAIHGELDPAVPRPIVDGHVQLSLQAGGVPGGAPAINRQFEAEVREDGSFVLEQLPPGRGQVFALCRGWVSKRTLADSASEAGHWFSEPPTPEKEAELLLEMGDDAYVQQRVSVPVAAEPFVILMEPTGSLRVSVTNEAGAPLSDAIVSASPNLRYIGVGSTIVPWREWHATTDAAGVASIEDLPKDESLWISAAHTGFRMRKVDRENNVSVAVLPGEVARATIVLEPK